MKDDIKPLLDRIDRLCGKIDELIDLMVLREAREQAATLTRLHEDEHEGNGHVE